MRVTVVSLNTRGVPDDRVACLARRYAAIGEAVDAGDADAVCFQEVFQLVASAAPGPADALVRSCQLPALCQPARPAGL